MLFDQKPYTLDRIFRLTLSVIIFACAIWLIKYLSDVLIPFAVALLLAYLLNPLVNAIQRKIPSRPLAVFAALILVVSGLVVVCLIAIPAISRELSHMAELLNRLAKDSEIAQRALAYLPRDIWNALQEAISGERVQQIGALLKEEKVMALAQAALKKMLPGVWSLIHGVASFMLAVLGLSIIVLYLVFLLIDYQRVKEGWKEFIPAAWRPHVVSFLSNFNAAMNQYFRAQALVASIVGVLFAAGFWLIGLPMAIVLGLFIGLLNMVPYLQIIGIIPAVFLAVMHSLETGMSLWLACGLTGLVFAVVQAIQDSLLVPNIMGKTTGLSPAVILLSLSVWGKLLGVLGLLIAIPMTCLFIAYYRQFLDQHQKLSSASGQ